MFAAKASAARKILVWLLGVGMVLYLAACNGPEHGRATEILRIGVLPDEGVEALRQRYTPLFELLSRETGLRCELIIPESYDDLLSKFGSGQVDLAYFGGVTFLKAKTSYDAIPLVMRDVDSRFTSVLFVAGSSSMTIADLKGKRFSFGSRLSTSGHFMPRHFLRHEYQITPEDYFGSIEYSGRHDRTAYLVRDGEVDAGVANAEIVRKMFADGRLREGDIRVIWTTPPYADYVWAMHPEVRDADRELVRSAFLKLSLDNPLHASVLASMGAEAFYPSSNADFSDLRTMMASMEAMQR